MNKSEIAEKAAREIVGFYFLGTSPEKPFNAENCAEIIERAIAESHSPERQFIEELQGAESELIRIAANLVRDRWPSSDSRASTALSLEAVANKLRTIIELGDGEPSRPPDDQLDEQFFYELMQLYRHMPVVDQAGTIAAFEAIKKYIRSNWIYRGAAQEVSPIGSVQKITGPERPRCSVCGAETTCLSCGTKTGGDTRELKAALKLVTEKFRQHFREGDHTLHWRDALNALAEAERLLGEPTKE